MDEMDNYHYFLEEIQIIGIVVCMPSFFLFDIMKKLVTI
jgi:hypothetical protein